jgi:hypothetical protein
VKSVKVLAAAAVLAFAVGSTTNAAGKPIELTPHVNVGLPTGDFGEGWGLGFGGGATIDFFAAPTFSIGARGSYTMFGGEEVTIDTFTVEVDNINIFEISGHGRYYFGELSKAFFVQGNVGMHMSSGGDESSSDFGFGFGAGKRIPMGASGKTALVPEVLYYIVPNDEFDATFFMFRLGLAFGLNKSGE